MFCCLFSLCNLCVFFLALAQANGIVMIYSTLMRLAAISFTFRFSGRRHGLTPLTLTLRKPSVITYSPWSSVSEQMFYQGALRQNSSSASRHSESAAQQCLRENEARCQCCQQWRVLNMSQDQGSRSPLLDALLTALMGMGIGEQQFGQRACFISVLLSFFLAGHSIRVARAVVKNVEDRTFSDVHAHDRDSRLVNWSSFFGLTA